MINMQRQSSAVVKCLAKIFLYLVLLILERVIPNISSKKKTQGNEAVATSLTDRVGLT